MTAYDFRSLSPLEFEDITRDLLQRKLNLSLEIFAPGRDGGVDLRHCADDGRTVVAQCKHYINTGYPALRATLVRELPQITRLSPSRYIVATSVQLTLKNKKELKSLLSPFVRRTSDIFGLRELNALLRDFPEVEKSHFKLWLTSTTVMQSLMHSATFNQTEWYRERIRTRAKLYVQNRSFFAAKELLDQYGFCIIAGNPGIGKTTLADMLVLDHLGHGFEANKVEHHVSEMKEVAIEGARQVFIYDDFLGQTSFEDKLDKNEDKALVMIIDKIRRSKHKTMRLILTTREYILNSAKRHYGPLADEDWHPFECVVSLNDYSRIDRAKVLYNHLYFSGLSLDYKKALLQDKRLLSIIDHEHYNPRIIDWMTDDNKVRDCTPGQYVDRFLSSLESPHLIWLDAVENKIKSASRHLLFTLGSLAAGVRNDDLEKAWEAFYLWRGKRYGFSCEPNEFNHALRELDGNFIAISKGRGDKREARFVQFHNPSIRDCIEESLKSNQREAEDLCRTASFFEQLSGMWNSVWKNSSAAVPDFFWNALQRTFDARSCTYVHSDTWTHLVAANIASRASFIIEIAKQRPSDDSFACVSFAIDRLTAEEQSKTMSSETAYLISLQLSDAALAIGEAKQKGLDTCKQILLANAQRESVLSSQFGEATRFVDQFPGALNDDEMVAMRERFHESLDDDVSSIEMNIDEYDIDEIQKALKVAERAATVLSVSVSDEIERLEKAHDKRIAYDEERAEGVESWPAQAESSDSSEKTTDEEITGMFDTLLVGE